jgi:Fe-S-cluster-containing hydrogenase component 2
MAGTSGDYLLGGWAVQFMSDCAAAAGGANPSQQHPALTSSRSLTVSTVVQQTKHPPCAAVCPVQVSVAGM